MTRDEFFATVIPALLTFLGVVVPALLAWMGAILKKWASKQNEQVNRQALHSALKTGVESAEWKYKNSPSVSDAEKVNYAIDHARKSVPDALHELSASTENLVKITQRMQQETRPCPPELSPQSTSSLPLPSSASL